MLESVWDRVRLGFLSESKRLPCILITSNWLSIEPWSKGKRWKIGSKNFEKFWKFLFSPPPLYLSFHEVWGRGRRVLRNCDDWVRRCVRLTVKSTLFPLYSSIANVPTTRDWSESWWHARHMQRYLFCISILFMPFHGHFVSQALLLFDL